MTGVATLMFDMVQLSKHFLRWLHGKQQQQQRLILPQEDDLI